MTTPISAIQIKSSSTSAAPGSLTSGELAYTSNGGILTIGDPANGTVLAIGGLRTPGTLTANQALVVNSTLGINTLLPNTMSIGNSTSNATINSTFYQGTSNQSLLSNNATNFGGQGQSYYANVTAPVFTTSVNVGSNVSISTSKLTFGNSIVNLSVNSTSITGGTSNPITIDNVSAGTTFGGNVIIGNTTSTGTSLVSTSNSGSGILGQSNTSTAVQGNSNSGTGVVGVSNSATGIEAISNTSYAIFAKSTSGNGLFVSSNTGQYIHVTNGVASSLDFFSNNNLIIYGSTTNYGLQINPLGSPASVTNALSSTGGSLTANTYYVKIVGVDAYGNFSSPSLEKATVTTGTTSQITFTWNSLAGTTSYQIYYATTLGGSGGEAAYFTSTTNNFTLTTLTGNTVGTVPSGDSTGIFNVGNSTVGLSINSTSISGMNPIVFDPSGQGSSFGGVVTLGSTTATSPPLVSTSNTSASIRGFSNTASAIIGSSNSGTGVVGNSNIGAGINGISVSGTGVFGQSNSGTGVGATTNSGVGMSATSNTNTGVLGTSTSGTALSGHSSTGNGLLVIANSGQYIHATNGVSASLDFFSNNNLKVYGSVTNYGMMINPLGAPSGITNVSSGTGGSLTANTYYVKIAAIDAYGNPGPASSETSTVTTGSVSQITYTWNSLAGAASYQIYYATTSGGPGSEAAYFTSTTNNFTLTTLTGNTIGSPQTTDSTANFNVGGNITINTSSLMLGNSIINTTSLGIGNSTVNATMNSTWIDIGNSTVNATINSIAINVGNATNYTQISYGTEGFENFFNGMTSGFELNYNSMVISNGAYSISPTSIGSYVVAQNFATYQNSTGGQLDSKIVGYETQLFNSNNSTAANSSVSNMICYAGSVYNYSSGLGNTNIMNAYGAFNQISTQNTSIINIAYGYYVDIAPGSTTVTGNINLAYGFNASIGLNSVNASIGSATLYYGQYPASANVTGVSYGVYITGEDQNFFSNLVSIGSNTTPTSGINVYSNGGTADPTILGYNASVGYGIQGVSNTGIGILAQSTTGSALTAQSTTGNPVTFGNTTANFVLVYANGVMNVASNLSVGSIVNVGANVSLSSSLLFFGNSTVNTTVNSTVFTGTANNATNLGGTAAASYQLNSTLSANVATLTSNNATNFAGHGQTFYANVSAPVFTTSVNVGSNVNITTSTITIGTNNSNFNTLTAYSNNATVINTFSNSGTGGSFNSLTSNGVYATSNTGYAVLGLSNTNYGGIFESISGNPLFVGNTTFAPGFLTVFSNGTTNVSALQIAGAPTFTGSVAANGYMYLGPIILQWGTVNVVSGTVTVAYPLQFPNGPLSITVTANDGFAGSLSGSPSGPNPNSHFVISSTNTTTTGCYWQCIGH